MTEKQQFINNIFKLVVILENTGDFIFSQVGLTVKTYSILYLISTGLDTSRDLLNGTYGSKPNMTKKLKFLEENLFIERSIDKNDKRVFRFSMTQKAKKSLEKVSPIYEQSISVIFEGINDIQVEQSGNLVKDILKNLLNCKK